VPNASIGGPPGESPDGVPEAGPPPDAARAAGFGAQVDLAALFTERALALTRPGGVTAFLVPAKLWRTLAGGALRALVLRESTPLALDDWSDAPNDFAAAVYPSLLVTRRHPTSGPCADPPPRPSASTAPGPTRPPRSPRAPSRSTPRPPPRPGSSSRPTSAPRSTPSAPPAPRSPALPSPAPRWA
jgi:hypothetical protein